MIVKNVVLFKKREKEPSSSFSLLRLYCNQCLPQRVRGRILNVSSVLSELEAQTPSLLDVFVSIIACSVETRNIVVQILKWAGFLPDGASTEKINVHKDS